VGGGGGEALLQVVPVHGAGCREGRGGEGEMGSGREAGEEGLIEGSFRRDEKRSCGVTLKKDKRSFFRRF